MTGVSGELLKHYRLVVRLGYGRSTDVLLATREVTPLVSEPVVVKRLHERFSQDPEFIRRFSSEAALLRLLDHPHIVKMLDAGLLEGRCCIAHEYLEGQPLRLLLRRANETGGLPRELAAYVASCALQGLHHAHEANDQNGRRAGVVHGNLTSHGLFVTNDGGVKLTDFKIATFYPGAADAFRSNSFYSAPEQDFETGVIDRRADVFSAGVVLWESLTGKNPFGDEQGATRVAPGAKRNVAAPSSVNARIPAPLDAIVARALAWDASARYQTAAEMQQDLDRWLASVRSNDAPAALGSLMRRLFGNEVVEQRRLVTVLRGGDDPVPSSRLGQQFVAGAPPTNGSPEPSSGPPTSRSPQRPASVPPPPPPLPPLTPPPISRPPPQSPSGALPNLPPPPVNKAAPTGAGDPNRPRPKTSALTFRALELASKREEEPPQSESEDSAPPVRSFDYRILIAVGAFCAGFSVLVTSLVIWNPHRRSAEATVAAREMRDPTPAATPEQPRAEPQRDETPIAQAAETAAVVPMAAQQAPAQIGMGDEPSVERANASRPAVARSVASPVAAPEPLHAKSDDTHAKREAPATKAETAAGSPPAEPARQPTDTPPPPSAAPEISAGTGFLTVDTSPWSLVSEGGKALGQTPLVHVELPVGVHVLVLKNPELGIETSYTVTIQPGKTLVKRIGIE
jgi:serine/threonine-protein kinase